MLFVITLQATKPLAIAVPNILDIFKKLLNLPICSTSTYLLDKALLFHFSKKNIKKLLTKYQKFSTISIVDTQNIMVA